MREWQCMAWFLKSASTPEEDLARCQILPPRWRRSPKTKDKGIEHQSETLPRLRSSKPLETRASVESSDVGSGTAASSLLATRKPT